MNGYSVFVEHCVNKFAVPHIVRVCGSVACMKVKFSLYTSEWRVGNGGITALDRYKCAASCFARFISFKKSWLGPRACLEVSKKRNNIRPSQESNHDCPACWLVVILTALSCFYYNIAFFKINEAEQLHFSIWHLVAATYERFITYCLVDFLLFSPILYCLPFYVCLFLRLFFCAEMQHFSDIQGVCFLAPFQSPPYDLSRCGWLHVTNLTASLTIPYPLLQNQENNGSCMLFKVLLRKCFFYPERRTSYGK
jgi:hypothetical protein